MVNCTEFLIDGVLNVRPNLETGFPAFRERTREDRVPQRPRIDGRKELGDRLDLACLAREILVDHPTRLVEPGDRRHIQGQALQGEGGGDGHRSRVPRAVPVTW